MELRTVLPTDSGMHALWDSAPFDGIVDYDTWESELLDDEDIERHITAGHLVPINIHSDGAFAFTVRADATAMPSLTADEHLRVVVSSEPYRLVSHGAAKLSGIEYVSADAGDGGVATVELPPGEFAVVVALMDYDDVPNKSDDHPDFIVLVGPGVDGSWRTSAETFESA